MEISEEEKQQSYPSYSKGMYCLIVSIVSGDNFLPISLLVHQLITIIASKH